MRRPSRPLVATLAWAIAAAAALTPIASAATTGVLTGYALTTWAESEDGPFGAIAAIAQDADGYLWIGTSAGLFRFDGVRFTPWHRIGATRLPAAAVTALLVGRDGRLWVGLDNGAGVAAIDKRQVELFDPRDVDSVTALAEGGDGTIWAVTDPGLYRLDGRIWTRDSGPQRRLPHPGRQCRRIRRRHRVGWHHQRPVRQVRAVRTSSARPRPTGHGPPRKTAPAPSGSPIP